MQSVVGQSSNAVGHGTHTAYNYVYNDLIGLPFHTRHHTCEWLLALKRAAWGHAGHATACSCCTTFSAFCRLKNLSKTIEFTEVHIRRLPRCCPARAWPESNTVVATDDVCNGVSRRRRCRHRHGGNVETRQFGHLISTDTYRFTWISYSASAIEYVRCS